MFKPMKITFALLMGLVVVACGDGEGPTEPPASPQPASISVFAGDNQTARVGTAVSQAPAAIVRDQDDNPMQGVRVTFTVGTGGGSVTGPTAVTGGNGVASVGSWTLGPSKDTNTLIATAQGLTGQSATFTASSRWPYWTVMVYLAADNNLATAGIDDIDEMEAAGVHPEVQVVMQAEFSPVYLWLEGCDASCFNRPNFNTFRHFVSSQEPDVSGPNGQATDIGNRDMTDPAELRDFVQWAKGIYPAEHYALVLWNHGGGYHGLIEDQTSAGSVLMSIGDLPAALNGVGSIDVLDFDMCLMGGYETLVMVDGRVNYSVFSEEAVPGSGNPYADIIDGIQADPTADGRAVAQVFVEQFHVSYQNDNASTTKSAYELAAFAGFESALQTLAGTLRDNLATLGTSIDGAAAGSQAYDYPQLKDLVSFLDSLRARTADPTLQGQIDAVRAEATGSFRVANSARTGTGSGINGGANDVSRSSGLNILMPSTSDWLPDQGPGSFADYESLYSGKEWTLFLADWLASQAALPYTDQGDARFEGYVVWNPQAVDGGADVDMWILEPNGNLYIPYLGSVTPNGVLTNDSYDNATHYEGYLTNRFIENGEYRFYANLWLDPNHFRPFYDLQYRYDQVSDLQSLYAPDYPRLSLQVSWLDDPTPTWAEVEAGTYTDLQFVAILIVGGGAPIASLSRADQTTGPHATRPTPEQLEAVRSLLSEPRRSERSRRPAPAFLQAPTRR